MASLNKLVCSQRFLIKNIHEKLVPYKIDDFKSMIDSKITKIHLLGIDIGKQKCGIAIANEERNVSIPLQIVATKILMQHLNFIYEKFGKFGLIVGLPLSLSGGFSASSMAACSVINSMSSFLNSKDIPMWFHDERFTTIYSYSLKKKFEKKDLVDHLCAMTILQEHLDFYHRLHSRPGP